MTILFITAKDFGQLNSREMALIIWSIVFIGIAVIWPKTRALFKQVLNSALKWQIMAIFSFFVSWMAISTILLKASGFWNVSLLKDTIVWTLFSGFALISRSVQARKSAPAPSLSQLIQDSFGTTVGVEFLFNLYTFPLWIEVLLLPVLSGLFILHATAKDTPKAEPAYRLLGCIVLFADLAILGYVGHSLYQQSQKLFSQDGASQFALPLILALCSIPALHLVTLYARHESLNIVINLKGRKPLALRFYICLKILDHLRLNLRGVSSVHRTFISELMAIQTHDDADEVLASIRRWSEFRSSGPEAIKMRSIERSVMRSAEINWPLVPLFKTPWHAAESVIQLGLKDTSDEESVWRFRDGEWYALSRLDIQGDTIFGIGNTITCMHGSNNEVFIEWSRWKLDIFDTEAAEGTTAKIAALSAEYLALLECEIPPDLFKATSKTSRFRETPQANFLIENFGYPQGYGWQLTITSKF